MAATERLFRIHKYVLKFKGEIFSTALVIASVGERRTLGIMQKNFTVESCFRSDRFDRCFSNSVCVSESKKKPSTNQELPELCVKSCLVKSLKFLRYIF